MVHHLTLIVQPASKVTACRGCKNVIDAQNKGIVELCAALGVSTHTMWTPNVASQTIGKTEKGASFFTKARDLF